MSISLWNGAVVDISTAFASSVNITALSNASPAVATATNTLALNDVVLIHSGWGRLNGAVARVTSPSGSAFTVTGKDTSNTSLFPVGSGVGSFQKVSTWQRISEVINPGSSGGEQQYNKIQLLETNMEQEYPTNISAMTFEFEVSEAMSSAQLAALQAAHDAQDVRAVRITMPNGTYRTFPAIISMAQLPSQKVNENLTRKVVMKLQQLPISS